MKKRNLLLLVTCALLTVGCDQTQALPDQQSVKITEVAESLPETGDPAQDTNRAVADNDPAAESVKEEAQETFDVSDIPDYDGSNFYVEINGNEPFFTQEEKARAGTAFYDYSRLDKKGRAGTAFACINKDSLPKMERDDGDELSAIYPSGWEQVEYGADYVQTGWLYNRSHLIGWALGGDTADYNIVTATRYCNATSMLWFEEECLSFVKSCPDACILYRVTPVFVEDNLTCSGLLMECLSVEGAPKDPEYGKNLKFCVYVYNIQPGIEINYATGSSHLIEGYDGVYATSGIYDEIGDLVDKKEPESKVDTTDSAAKCNYILNTNSKKIHMPDCPSVSDISKKNKQGTTETIEQLISEGYTKCKRCNP